MALPLLRGGSACVTSRSPAPGSVGKRWSRYGGESRRKQRTTPAILAFVRFMTVLGAGVSNPLFHPQSSDIAYLLSGCLSHIPHGLWKDCSHAAFADPS